MRTRTPVATPFQDTCARRHGLGRALLAVGFGLFALGSVARAAGGGIQAAAEPGTPAERVTTTTVSGGDGGGGDGGGGGLLFPIDPVPRCEVLNNYGGYSKYFGAGGHQGVDIGADLGQEVFAVESGVLYRQWSDPSSSAGLGWGLHANSDTKYRYFHLSEFAEGLAVGDLVVAGDVIGYVGDTGNATPGGWHLHFEIRPGPAPHATTVDPVPLLDIPETCRVY